MNYLKCFVKFSRPDENNSIIRQDMDKTKYVTQEIEEI